MPCYPSREPGAKVPKARGCTVTRPSTRRRYSSGDGGAVVAGARRTQTESVREARGPSWRGLQVYLAIRAAVDDPMAAHALLDLIFIERGADNLRRLRQVDDACAHRWRRGERGPG